MATKKKVNRKSLDKRLILNGLSLPKGLAILLMAVAIICLPIALKGNDTASKNIENSGQTLDSRNKIKTKATLTTQAPTTPASTSTSSSTPKASTPSAGSATPTLTDAQAAAAYCSVYLGPMQSNEQADLNNGRLSSITNINSAITGYYSNLETADQVNQLIQEANTNMVQGYQGNIAANAPSVSHYGCQVTLTPENPLPSFNPPVAWNP